MAVYPASCALPDIRRARGRKMYKTRRTELAELRERRKGGDARCCAAVCKSNSALFLDLTQRNLLSYSLGSSHFSVPLWTTRAASRTCVKNIETIIYVTTTESNSNEFGFSRHAIASASRMMNSEIPQAGKPRGKIRNSQAIGYNFPSDTFKTASKEKEKKKLL